MKKMLLISLTMMSIAAWAQTPSTTPAGATPQAGSQGNEMHGNRGEHHPCKKIEDACKAAGFIKGGAKDGKGLYKNCMMPLLQGQAVNGVTIGADDVADCKAKKDEHHGMQGQH